MYNVYILLFILLYIHVCIMIYKHTISTVAH